MVRNEKLMKLVEDYQYKKSVCYPKTNERIYCNLKVFYILSFAYLMIFSAILTLGINFVAVNSPKHYLYNTIISMVLYTAAFVLMFFKLNLISLILNIAATFFKVSPLVPMLILNAGAVDIKHPFYWQHLLPVILVFIASIWMCIISTREKYLISRDTKRVLENLYTEHHTDDMSEEEWEKFMEEYDSAYTAHKLKRSMRKKQQNKQ